MRSDEENEKFERLLRTLSDEEYEKVEVPSSEEIRAMWAEVWKRWREIPRHKPKGHY